MNDPFGHPDSSMFYREGHQILIFNAIKAQSVWIAE